MSINTVTAEQLTRVIYDDKTLRPPTTWFLNQFFTNVHRSDKQEIFLNKVAGAAKLAPLVVPTAQGRPVYERAESVEVISPAYLKPKDSVDPDRVIQRQAGFGEFGPYMVTNAMSPQERLNAIRVDILREHKHSIYRRWEWMAVRAIVDAQVVLEGPDYPRTVVDFRRDPTLSPTLPAADMWNNTAVDIVDQVEAWMDAMQAAPFGGAPSMMIMGNAAWAAFRKNVRIKEMMTRDVITIPQAEVERGVRSPQANTEFRQVGYMTNGLPIYVFSAQYQDENGQWQYYMDQRDVLLVGDVMGAACYGAIKDLGELRPLEMWSKSWMEQDPSSEFIMTQSAPLMFPSAPNRSFHVRVLP